MKINIISILLLFASYVTSAQYPTINSNRPRIWVDSTRIAWLQSNVTLTGDCQNTFNDIQTAYNNWWINDPQLYLLGSDSTLWNWNWNSEWSDDEAQLSLITYKLSYSPLELKRCRFIARQVIETVNTTNFSTMPWYPKEDLLRKLSATGDLLLDWCYDEFPATLRDSLAQSIYALTSEFMNTYIYSSEGNSYVASHNVWNNIYCNQNALVLYQASGLSLAQLDTVNQWYEDVYDKFTNGFIPCWTYYRDDDGGWNWGAAYSMWSLTDQFQLFENMRIGTNKNYYTDLPWVQNSINQYIYFIQPNEKCIHLGDGEMSMAGDRVIYLHARVYNDPRSLWMAQYYSQPMFTGNTMDKFSKLLYKDFNIPIVTQPNSALNWWSDKVGLSVSRSSWNSDATMLTYFDAPSKKSAHEHRENNSFTIFKNKPLLIESGYYDTYGGSHYENYYQRTIAHNSICVYDSTDNYSCFGNPASNDGGQIESLPLENYNDILLPQNQRGQWIQYATGTNYAYNVSDAQLSYDTAKLDFFRRKLLYLSPNKVIVLDYVHLNNITSNQRDIKWVGHFVNQPSINSSVISTSVPNHIETFNGNDCFASNGNGNIAMRTLLPDSTTTTRIGGSGYEYWVDGVNYPPSILPDTNFYTPGSWRVEIRPHTITDTVIYLHTIAIGDNLNPAVAGGIKLQNNISIGTDWSDTLYFFSAKADTGMTYHYFNQINGNRTTGLFAFDLKVGNYQVKIDGVSVSTIATDTNGILQGSVFLGSGSHLVEIAKVATGIDTEFSLRNKIHVYPNPSKSELNVVLPIYADAYTIDVYNSLGIMVQSYKNIQKIDISNYGVGIYFIIGKLKDRVSTATFIKE